MNSEPGKMSEEVRMHPVLCSHNKPLNQTFVEVLQSVINEYWRAKEKHGEYTMDGEKGTDLNRLSALTEELGEAARCLTYDKEHAGSLKKELIQVANVALTWASILYD